MVSFVCDACQETVKKPKVERHLQMCNTRSLHCVDCGKEFQRDTVRFHTSCMTEAEKYEGKLYRTPRKTEDGPKTPSETTVDPASLRGPPWTCDLCKVTCTGRENLVVHMQCKKHVNRAKRQAQMSSANKEEEEEESTSGKRKEREEDKADEADDEASAPKEKKRRWKMEIQRALKNAGGRMEVKDLREVVCPLFGTDRKKLETTLERKLQSSRLIQVTGSQAHLKGK